METDWAAQNLQVIRTLMERSALYRRALAPVMIATGALGLLAAVLVCFVKIETNVAFSGFWMAVAAIAFLATLFLVRRQSLQEAEPFWSPPTRRVFQAFLPNFLTGLAAGILLVVPGLVPPQSAFLLPPIWMIAYGCGVHAAGFFMRRGIKLWGWLFVIAGIGLLIATFIEPRLRSSEAAHYVMGGFFGVLHLAYGGYLYLTEKRKNEL